MQAKQVLIIGGGAAGFFAAMACAAANPALRVTILEKSPKLLAKVKVSGGGRCNVTHACFDARELVKFYPRGEKQLLGPFTRFNPSHTIQWFEKRGVDLKTEADGRMFPVTDDSQTIIDCYLREAKRLGIQIRTQCGVYAIGPHQGGWEVKTGTGENLHAAALIITTGGTPQVWKMLAAAGIAIVPPVPSLFTFNITDPLLKGLEGISVPAATVRVEGSKLQSGGPMLITHWGLSGPAVLKLSAFGARTFADMDYKFSVLVNWLGERTTAQVIETLKNYKLQHAKQQVIKNALYGLPLRLWKRLAPYTFNYADLSNKHIEQIAQNLTALRLPVHGKSTFKEEFVTAGGVSLPEIDFKTMQHKQLPGLYFAGEVLDIDAVTGGFNFQAAWTTGWIAGNAAATACMQQ